MFQRIAVAGLALLALGLVFTAPPAAAEQRQRAAVQADGSLKMGSRRVQLYGIYIPPSNRVCRKELRPIRCGSRAVLALDRRVDRFVACDFLGRGRDGVYQAVCRISDEADSLGPEIDLAAWMLYHGWAVALPGAPFEYVTLERIAQAQTRGIWGFQVDRVSRR